MGENSKAPYGKCIICMDARDQTHMIGGHWEAECFFLFCAECLVRYVSIKVRDYIVIPRTEPVTIMCLGPGCPYELSDADVMSLCQSDVYGNYLKALAESHQTRYKEARHDPLMHRYIKETKVRCCPACKILTEKNNGCNHVACICGEDWCYACGRGDYFNHTCINCTRCNNSRAGHTASECKESRCKKCRLYGHEPNDCHFYAPRCTRCQEWYHKSSECKAQKCTQCQGIGHLAANCTAPKCAKCGKRGHVTKRCPANCCRRCLGYGHTTDGCKKIGACMVCESEECWCDEMVEGNQWEGYDVDVYGRAVCL